MEVITKKGKLFCPLCNVKMVKAYTDPKSYKEHSLEGDVVDIVHIYYGCTNDQCQTQVRLRFRKDGQPGDLWRMNQVQQDLVRQGAMEAPCTEIPGGLEKMEEM